MAIISALLTDIKLRYRHPYTDPQVVVWMNDEQTELFEILEIDSVPYGFNTVATQHLYPIDVEIDIDRIKQLTIQINDTEFLDLPFKRTTDEVSEAEYWYTLIERNFYVNVPGGSVNGRAVYVYLDSQPTDINPNILNVEPAIPKRYQEILKLGTLERIAAARKDADMKTNFANDKEAKIADVEWKMKMSVPEWVVPVDTMPRAGRYRNGRSVVGYPTS